MPQVYELDIHGTADKYKRGGCRCDKCTAAWSRTVPHGTISGYISHKCHCDLCKNAKRKYELARLGRPVTPEPTPQAAKGEWNLEVIKGALTAYVKKHDRIPRDKETEGLPEGRHWSAARNWAAKHGYTLRMLADDPRQHSMGFEWSIEVITTAAVKHENETGEWPASHTTAHCEDFGGRCWQTAHQWLVDNHGITLRGLKPSEPPRWNSGYTSGMEARL